MKYISLKSSRDPQEIEGVVYFAQLLNEMMFDFSLDTFKPSALNTRYLFHEALIVIQDVEKGILDKKNVDPILDELILNVQSDLPCGELLSLETKTIIRMLSKDHRDLKSIKTLLYVCVKECGPIKYLIKTRELLSNALKNNNEKENIRSLARIYITTLINMNYHPSYISEVVKNTFYFGKNEINSVEDLDGFFDLFEMDAKKYDLLFKVTNVFSIFKQEEELGAKLINTADDLPSEFQAAVLKHNFDLRNYEKYFLIEDLQSNDYHSAKVSANNLINLISSTITLYHHKEMPIWENECIIKDNLGETFYVGEPINPMVKCIDFGASKANKKVKNYIENFGLVRNSYDSFLRSSELHALARRTNSIENQLINLWIALEAIIPSRENESRNKIDNVIYHLNPFLILNYLPRLMERLKADIYLWDKKLLQEIGKNVEGENYLIKISNLISLEENIDYRKIVKAKFDDFYLLRNRFYQFEMILKSKKSIATFLDRHKERVNWQIKRIYRTRNKIVHGGKSLPYTKILVENLHDYLDILMSSITKSAINSDHSLSLEQIYLKANARFDEYLHLLKEPNTINKENMKENIFPKF